MSAIHIANDVILYASQNEYAVTNLKLQKTLYYLQGYFGKAFGTPFFDDDIEHWPYGPVVPSVYFEYCSFGASTIYVQSENAPFLWLRHNEKKIVTKVLDKCLSMTARELVDKSHKEAPWATTNDSKLIPFELVLDYFQKNDPLALGSL